MGRRIGAIAIAVTVGLLTGGISELVPSQGQSAITLPESEKVQRSLPRPLTESWTYRRQADDTPIAESCGGQSSNPVCVAVACRSGVGLTFEYFGPGRPSDNDRAAGSVFVSTLMGVQKVEIDWTLLNRPFERRAPLSEGLADLLTLGGRGLYEDEERKLPFTLTGSADAIDAVRLRCR